MSGFTHEATVAKTHNWYTPPYIFEALGVDFDLDPCHPEERLPWVPAGRVLTKRDDGLKSLWLPGESIWGNYPYDAPEAPCAKRCKKKRCVGRGHCVTEYQPGLIDWMAKHAGHVAASRGSGIALTFVRTDATWFQDHGTTAEAVCLLDERVQFVDATGKPPIGPHGKPMDSPGAPSMLLAWGSKYVAALDRCGLGPVYEPRARKVA